MIHLKRFLSNECMKIDHPNVEYLISQSGNSIIQFEGDDVIHNKCKIGVLQIIQH